MTVIVTTTNTSRSGVVTTSTITERTLHSAVTLGDPGATFEYNRSWDDTHRGTITDSDGFTRIVTQITDRRGRLLAAYQLHALERAEATPNPVLRAVRRFTALHNIGF